LPQLAALSAGHKELDAVEEARWATAIHMAATRDSTEFAAWLTNRSTPAAAPQRTDHDGALHCL